MEWYQYLAVVGVGLVAGIINTLAAGGSLLTLPLLVFLGIPSTNANAINRIAILLQNVVAVRKFQKKQVLDLKQDYKMGIPAVIGSVAGALIATVISAPAMDVSLGVIMLVMFLVVLLNPGSWVKGKDGKPPVPLWLQYVIFFFIGIYGGFIQAGVGFFLLTGLVLGCGCNLVKANAIKVLIILLYTPVALTLFIIGGLLTWEYAFIGLFLAAGNMMGAYIGVNIAVKRGAKFLRYMLLVAIFIASLRLIIPRIVDLFS